MTRRFSDIEFEFLSAAANQQVVTLRGTVIMRDGEMVLEVESESPGERPYLILGKLTRGFYSGQNDVLQDDNGPVRAKWILLDDIYIGTWLEDRVDSVFRFRLERD